VLPAWAGGPEEDAKTFFAQGRQLRAAGKCAEAIIPFRRALEVYPEGLGSLRNIAECEEELGLFASARRDWWDLRRAALQSNEAKYQGWKEDAEARYHALADKVAKLTIKLTGDSLDRVRVVIDGKPVDPRLLDVELERDLGPHTIEAFYGGAAPILKKLELTRGEREVVVLEVPQTAVGPVKGDGKPSDGGTAPAPSAFDMRTAGFVALGVGGVSAVGTAIAIGVRAGALSAIEEECTETDGRYSCPESMRSNEDTGRTASTLTNVFGAVAIAGLGVGITLVIIGSSDAGPSTTGSRGASLQVGPTRGGGTARLTGRF
jgi:hypothetical protein